MTIQFRCKGCRHESTEPETEHARRGYCMNCHAKGIGLKQIKKVEKWEARDGTFHDSLEAAQTHQLMAEVTTALRTCKGREEDQARQLLFHFYIVRRGDMPKGMSIAPATVEYHKAPNVVCTTCYFLSGAVVGALITLALIWFR